MIQRYLTLIAALAMLSGCSSSRKHSETTNLGEARPQERTQFLLQQHNAHAPVITKIECISSLESLLDSITGYKYVFIGYAPERWTTGGQQALFVPYQSRLGSRNLIVTLVVDDFCKIEGLIWPE